MTSSPAKSARARALLAVLFIVFHAAPAWAAPPRVAAATLPSRDPRASELAAAVRRVGEELARRRGVALGVESGGVVVADVVATLARGQELAAAGALDDAARLLDDGLASAMRAPHRFAGSDLLLAACVTRASIALARGEQARADELLARVRRWDPSFELAPAEDAPRLRAALAGVNGSPALRADDLGELCSVDELLVARRVAAGRIEVLRLARCKVVARVVVAQVDDDVLALLDVAPLPPPPPGKPAEATAVWQRTWFWLVVGAATATAGVVIWQAGDGGESLDVVPHY